jgi:hypothetical protein
VVSHSISQSFVHARVAGFLTIVAATAVACAPSPDTAGTQASPPAASSAHSAVHSSDLAPAGLRPASAADSAFNASMKLTVHKTPTCLCCANWVDHMRSHGFQVEVKDYANLDSLKRSLDVPGNLQTCHTAVVGTYLIEGHVPAEDVTRLLRERLAVAGLAVPRMPAGSPGMEMGLTKDRYEVLTFDKSGATKVFSVR